MRETTPIRNPSAAWTTVDGDVVIISPEDSVLHELNATASFIWKQATGERTGRAIAEMLASEYEVAPETALTDTEELIAHLIGKNLLLAGPPAVEAQSDA